MWTYTATVVEIRREPAEELTSEHVYALFESEDKIFMDRLLDAIIATVEQQYVEKSGFYYVEWGYGSEHTMPTVYRVHRIGDLAPPIYPMDSIDNMALNSGGMF